MAGESVRRYTDAALSPRQPKVIDLIPARRWTNLVLCSLMLSCAAALEALYGYVALGYIPVEVSQLPAIDLASPGNIATWFCSALLASCGVMGVLTYQIRRHRVDDYRGRYRMWYWMVAVMLLASVDRVAGVQETVRIALLYAAGIPDYADALLVWNTTMAVIVAAIVVRLALEMRASRLATLCLLVSLACLGVVLSARLEWCLVDGGVFRHMAMSGLTMGGHIALFMATCLYARHVHRDACGQVACGKFTRRDKVKKRRRSQDVSGATLTSETQPAQSAADRRLAGKLRRQDAAHVSQAARTEQASATPATSNGSVVRPARKEKRRVPAQAAVAGSASPKKTLCAPDEDHVEERQKLSKAERKRLRRQRRQDRQ